MSKYKGLFTFDEDNHRYVPIAQADGIIDTMDYEPAEPLIKDEKIRKAVRAWADGNNIGSVHYDAFWRGFRRANSSITVWEELPLEDNEVYTIAELCGEEEE